MKKKVESKLKPIPLFAAPVKEVKIIAEPKKVINDTVAIVKQSEVNGWISIYQPDAPTDRFVLISPTKERFACKFYNREKDDFVGQSLLSIYRLREHFDRSIITEEVR